ncbi:MAG: metallophosphoesterase [Hyphomicrobiaceae bacterium]
MIIAQISDTHIALDTPDADRRLSDFARTIAHINALDPQPDLIVHTGDIVHNGRPDEYAQAVAVLAEARAPAYALAGNKDDRANLRAAFSTFEYLSAGSGPIQYAIDDFPIRLLLLDTLSTTSGKGDFCAERARHLIAMIDADATRPIAAFAHHPPFEVLVGPERIHFEDATAMERLREALQHSGRVVGLFCGHVHRPTTGAVGRIPVTVATSLATTLRKGEYPAEMKDRPIYLLHRFEPDGCFVTETQIV